MSKIFTPTPHPVLKLPKQETITLMASTPEGKEKLLSFLMEREKRIELMERDPLYYGYEPDIWKEFDRLLETHSEILAMGGNRATKSEKAAKAVVKKMMEDGQKYAACFHSSSDSSIRQQQPRIHKFLPEQYRDIGKPKGDRVTNVSYTQKNGFADNTFILPDGSQCFFFNYKQDVTVMEGYEFDIAWFDELVPRSWLEAVRFRLITRAGVMIVTFTAVEGYTPPVKEFIAGACPLKTERARLLKADEVHVKGCPKGHMPRTMQSKDPERAAIFFWTEDNPFNPYGEMVKKLATATVAKIMLRAYGWTDKEAGAAFAKFRQRHMGKPCHVLSVERWKEIEAAGVTYYCACDPAPAKNWFIKWYAVTPQGWIILFKEWPDQQNYGDWAIPGDKLDWLPGPAQRAGAGRGFKAYKELIWTQEGWVWDEESKSWDTSNAIDVHSRVMDPRMGGSPVPSEDEGVTVISLLDTDEYDAEDNLRWPAMIWEKGSGKQIFGSDTGVQTINDWLDFDEEQELHPLNCPRFYVVENCKQSILALEEWTGQGSNKCALKDIVDPDRYFALSDPQYIEPGMFGTVGGGSW